MSEYSFETSKSGAMTVKYKNKYIHSKYDPVKEGEAWALANYCTNEHVLIFGFGLGYHLIAFAALLKPYQTLYIMDTSLTLYTYAKDNKLLSCLDKNNIIIIIPQDKDIAKSRLGEILRLQSVAFLIYKPALEVLKSENRKLYDIIDGFYLRSGSINYFKDTLLKNKEINIRKGYENALRKFSGMFEGKTVVIAGAGGSLGEDMDALKHFKENGDGYVVAVGRVAAGLCAKGIIPDFMLAIDPQRLVMYPIQNVANIDIPLVFISTCHHAVSEYKGPKYILYTDKEDDSLTIETGGSVTTTAIDFSKKLGARAIVLSGVDLCYNGETSHFGTNVPVPEVEETVLANDNNIYKTNRQMLHYKRWIEHYISKNKAVKFFTLANRGARIEGCTFIKREDLKNIF